ncbi:MAG: CHC2 zinc finger domain-containing protein, partial [Gammaproteobacteria bacterium]|nr:CHC2 zinc finger domain-containing protein [Gammaproteobacteria bacterium]
MASIDELKAQIDLDDLAAKLGLVKPKGMPNYSAPHRKDSKPSLSVYNNGKSWKDHGGDAGGSCVDLVMYVEQCEAGEAVKRLHELYDIPRDNQPKVQQQKSLAEFIADKCYHNTEPVKDYLKTRGLSAEIIDKAIKKKAVGFNDYIGRDKQSKQPIEK